MSAVFDPREAPVWRRHDAKSVPMPRGSAGLRTRAAGGDLIATQRSPASAAKCLTLRNIRRREAFAFHPFLQRHQSNRLAFVWKSATYTRCKA